MGKKKETKEIKDKKVLTIFILFFPSVILVALSGISNPIMKLTLQMLVLLYQFVVIRNLVFEYYMEEY